MLLSERTSRGIEACYDAVLAPGRWPTALQLLGEALGAESCTFATCNEIDGPFGFHGRTDTKTSLSSG